MKLAAALDSGDESGLAREVLRGYLDEITIPADNGLFQVKGNLGKMLEAAGGKAVCEIRAGACNRRYLQLWNVAS
jgi:hypothetical protein